ncbi:MAG: hypothetical protein M0R49_07035, partial [Limnochordia bacterium]|nr:hypothetical protein [Limnochordia bacterium]
RGLKRYELAWGLDAHFDLQQLFRPQIETRWKLVFPLLANLRAVLNHNQDHFTSGEIFRLINKNQYTADSYSAILQSPQVNLGILRQVPFKSRDVVDALFVESVLELGNLSLRGLQLQYAGRSEAGSARILQAGGKLGNLAVEAATGWQVDFRGEESRARVLELRGDALGFSGNLVLQQIDPGFLSLLAKTNQYTPNRRGWELDLSTEYGQINLSLNLRRHTNMDATRDYRQLVWKLAAKDKPTSLEWRIQPTPAVMMRYALGDTLLQFDPLNSTLRTDFAMGEVTISIRLHALRQIGRLECKFGETLRWRLIGKYDFLEHRTHYSVLIEHDHLKLEIGQYDRGNMTSGFNNPSSFCISWGWKF